MSVPGLRRILLTGDTEGGVWTFALELADGLLSRGFEVFLATFGRTPTDSHKQSATEIGGLRWLHCTSKLEWMPEAWADIGRAGHWLSELARQWRPDLTHLNTLCHGTLPWDVPVVLTHHSCVSCWWQAVKRSPLPLNWHRYKQEVEHSLRAATVISAPTRSALQAVANIYNVDLRTAGVVPNGRSRHAFQARDKEDLILSAGRLWDEAKNVNALTAVASELPWPVYLAGDSRNLDGSETALTGCHFLGKLDTAELAAWYARAAIYALPARYEPFGLSILEAALSGCALVLGDIPSLRETWHDAAAFVAPDDLPGLQEALLTLIADNAHRARMGKLAYTRGREFTQSRMVDGYVSLYESALRKHAEARGTHACAS